MCIYVFLFSVSEAVWMKDHCIYCTNPAPTGFLNRTKSLPSQTLIASNDNHTYNCENDSLHSRERLAEVNVRLTVQR